MTPRGLRPNGAAVAPLELPAELRERAAEVPGADALVLEAFEQGLRAGAERLASELLGHLFDRQLELGRLYEAPSPVRAAVLERTYQDRTYPPAIEAHFGATGVVLNDLHAELRRVHPSQSSVRAES